MKNLLILCSFFFALSLFTSCEKDYTCECTSTVTDLTGNETSTTTTTTLTGKKGDAEDACAALNATTENAAGSVTVSCELN